VALTTRNPVHGALLFDDEFNGTAVDTSKWQVFQDNDQLGGYENTWDATSVTESGGALHLTAKMLGDVEVSGGMWTQGKVAIQPYGYWEMRARIPAASGTWPAFWAIPYDLNDGAGDDALSVYEIDTMEAIDHCVADRQAISWNVHLRRPDGTDNNPGNASLGTEMYSGYHIYATQWSPGLIVWYVDGVEQFRVADANIPTTRMTAIVQMATGGYQNPLDRAQLPQTMDVDWIRIYANP
jgi:beta-glucanase (GH16 family)